MTFVFLVHLTNLHAHKHPDHVAQCQDAYAYNEAEPLSIFQGILAVPTTHHCLLPYAIASMAAPTPAYVEGVSTPAYYVRKGSQQ